MFGAGLFGAMMLVNYLVAKFELTPLENKQNIQNPSRGIKLERITLKVKKVSIFDGRIIVVTTVQNNNPYSLEVSLKAEVFYDKQPIEECYTYLGAYNLKNAEIRNISTFCKIRWDSLNPEKLTAAVMVSTAELVKD